MTSILTVTTAAPDRNLLTLAELRTATGVVDNSRDAELTLLGTRVSASITAACRVRQIGTTPPTLRKETLNEIFRMDADANSLILARRPVVEVLAITEIETALDDDYDFETDLFGGMIYRLSADVRRCWPCGKIAVAYSAGWETVPEDLKLAATKYVQALRQQGDRDPMLKSKTTEGVSSYEWWVDPTKESVVPAEVMDLLERGGYVNHTWFV